MDKPSQLREVSNIFAELGANVISVHHERASEKMNINGCFLRIVLETKNYDHIAQIKSALIEAGFRIVN
jgi:threonine dehydratase